MAQTKLIVVFGATGRQGGSVVDTFLDEPNWHVRGVTRNPSSSKAQALASRGVEVVKADLNNPTSLTPALEGAHAIFAVSDFWSIYPEVAAAKAVGDATVGDKPANEITGDREAQQLKNVIDAAAKVSGLERFVLSALQRVDKWSGGKYTKVYHFDGKGKAAEYGAERYPELWEKTSVFQAGMFVSFLLDPTFAPKKTEQGALQWTSNISLEAKLPAIAAEEDTGPFVKALVDGAPGKNVIGYREWLTFDEILAAFMSATGLKAEVVRPQAGDASLPMPPDLLEEMDQMMEYMGEFGYEARDDPTVIHPKDLEAPPKLPTVEEYFKKQDLSKFT